jgi:hypothetical protein
MHQSKHKHDAQHTCKSTARTRANLRMMQHNSMGSCYSWHLIKCHDRIE